MRDLLRGAWRTAVPEPGDRHGPLPPLLLALTVLSGMIDAVSYLMLGHVFVANMTGNVVFLGFALAGAPGFSVTASVVALVAFAVGAFLGGRLLAGVAHRGRALLRTALVETVLLAAAALVVAVFPVGDAAAETSRHLATTLLALAMGIQNAMVGVLAVPDLTTTVLTRTITAAFADTGRTGRLEEKAGRQLLSVLTLAAGAAAGAVLVRHAEQAVALGVPAALALTVALAAVRPARSAAGWRERP
ncbi:YoaK family protein [Kitasatospora sp. NPDC058965]|uniref:YoaK family protein n=1 Tax=Kitasatospora sp. NPDC058965 TaxID=3346682 RepID=UPI00368C5C3C